VAVRKRILLVPVIAGLALVLAGCTDGAQMAQEFVDYTHDHPLSGGEVLQASGYKDTSECGCSRMRVVLGVDGADTLTDLTAVAANLASVLDEACAFDPSSVVEEKWVVDRIGPRRDVSVSGVISGDSYGLSGVAAADCKPDAIARRAAALVDRIAKGKP
jgi:hypothetical protein